MVLVAGVAAGDYRGGIVCGREDEEALSTLNDRGKSFSEIADLIEDQL